ncbi:hypothetical protein CAPTEDRAFT_186590 [Capitella teleta]|uniref:Apple domain-containing protein n=1 Tax=Capitella teleta TaxID=283909 RepID=R7U4L4_CAPTE|nr:hypothetical protein CAPTEDRAFT_186590 [Capitella teleta]|eukprot:ELU01041.1 hypothetical protein CAPTEDRAFT_186590 [Capitella teleta]
MALESAINIVSLGAAMNALPDGCSWISVNSRRLVGWNNWTVDASNMYECRNICERHSKFECRSVEFCQTRQRCILSEGNRADSHLTLWPTKEWRYNEVQCQAEVCNRSSCALVGPVHNRSMVDRVFITYPISTLEKCEEACRREEKFYCASFTFKSYQAPTGMCVLHERDRSRGESLIFASHCDYYELSCDSGVDPATPPSTAPVGSTTYDPVCWFRGPVVGYSAVFVHNFLTGLTRSECESKCGENGFCKAYSYDAQRKLCVLHSSNREDAALRASPGVDYYEYNCKSSGKRNLTELVQHAYICNPCISVDLANQCIRFAERI